MTLRFFAHRNFTITGIMASARVMPSFGLITIGFDVDPGDSGGSAILNIDKAGTLTSGAPPVNWAPYNVTQGDEIIIVLMQPLDGLATTAKDVVFYIMGEAAGVEGEPGK